MVHCRGDSRDRTKLDSIFGRVSYVRVLSAASELADQGEKSDSNEKEPPTTTGLSFV